MKRWIGSLLIAVTSSLVTLLLAWSGHERQESAPSADISKAIEVEGVLVSASPDRSADVLQELALLDQSGQGEQARQPGSGQASGPDVRNHLGDGINPTDLADDLDDPATRAGVPGDAQLSAVATLPEFCERCLEVARDIDPALAKRLADLRQRDPAEFERSMRVAGRKLFALAELKQRDAFLYGTKLNELKTELAVRHKAREVREARAKGSLEAETLEKQLRSLIAIQLGLSIKARGELVCQLQEKINAIRSDIEYQATHFNEILESRFQAMTAAPAPGNANPVLDAGAEKAALPVNAVLPESDKN